MKTKYQNLAFFLLFFFPDFWQLMITSKITSISNFEFLFLAKKTFAVKVKASEEMVQ
jgi:hypothetical protein